MRWKQGAAFYNTPVTKSKLTPPSKTLRSEETRSAPATAAFDAQALLATLPGLPGVYRMIGAQGEALYVGKRSEEHTSELQSHSDLVCRLLLEKKKQQS